MSLMDEFKEVVADRDKRIKEIEAHIGRIESEYELMIEERGKQPAETEAVLSRIAAEVDEKARPWWLSKIIREWEDGSAK